MTKVIVSAGIYINLPDLLVETGACSSKSAADRLIKAGAVEINEEKALERKRWVFDGDILHCGKRFWRKLSTPPVEIELEMWEDDGANYAKVLDIRR